MAGVRAKGTGGAYYLSHFMERATQPKPSGLGIQVQPAGLNQKGIEKHRRRAEQHHAAHGHRTFMRRAAQRRFKSQNGRSPADGAACSRKQGRLPVKPEQFHAAPHAYRQCAADHQQRDHQARPANVCNFLQADPQAEQGHGYTEQGPGAEVYARAIAGRQAIFQHIAAERPGNNAKDQRAEAKLDKKGQGSHLADAKGENRNENHALEHCAAVRDRCVRGRTRGGCHGILQRAESMSTTIIWL